MKPIAQGLAVFTLLAALEAAADCALPTLVARIPDGATAREADLLAAQAQVRAYVAAMDGFIACQNEELRANAADAASEYLYQMASRVEFARKEVDAVATRFNAAVEAFRANQARTFGAPPPSELPPSQSQFPTQQSPFPPSQSQFPAPQSGSPASQPGLTPNR